MPDPSLAPIQRERWDRAAAAHLLSRAGFGGTPDQVQALVDMGPAGAVDYLVEYEGIAADPTPDDLFDAANTLPVLHHCGAIQHHLHAVESFASHCGVDEILGHLGSSCALARRKDEQVRRIELRLGSHFE